jgi:hypothetical protein
MSTAQVSAFLSAGARVHCARELKLKTNGKQMLAALDKAGLI